MRRSFRCALKGVLFCLKSERNFRFHAAAAFYVVLAGAAAGLSKAEWAAVILCIGAVTGGEVLNTAVEKLCDSVHPEKSREIGVIKDMAAGAVLLLAAASAAVGGIVFFDGEKIERALSAAREHTWAAAAAAASLPAAAFLVFRSYGDVDKNSDDRNSRASQRR